MIKTVSVFHRNLYLLVLNVGNGWEWELLGLLLIVGQWIIPENSLRLAQVRYKMMIPNGNHQKKIPKFTLRESNMASWEIPN
jgi:hypothetical protein